MDDETRAFLRELCNAVDTIIGSLDGLDGTDLNWVPPVAGANSLYVIANHSLANAERNVMSTYCGEPYDHRRTEEFLATGDSCAPLKDRWAALRGRMEAGLSAVGPQHLAELCEHANLGRVAGREVLLRAVAHAAEHAGEAGLTRKWLLGLEWREGAPGSRPRSSSSQPTSG